MAVIGRIEESGHDATLLAKARERAALLPDCLVEARRVANSVAAGWHGRRRRGIGENFWQFRAYDQGESLSRIDWRRSARDDNAYVRELEWEAAHTVWLWSDLSASMRFRSTLALASKQERALVLMLALAEILARSGERIGAPAVMEPVAARNAAERLATALAAHLDGASETALPDTAMIRSDGDIVLIGDFLDDAQETADVMAQLAGRRLRGHLVEIADPAEEVFPYAGRTEFSDPETGARLLAGRAETLAEDYRKAYLSRRGELSQAARCLGWSFITSRTDRPASEALIALDARLSGQPSHGIAAGGDT